MTTSPRWQGNKDYEKGHWKGDIVFEPDAAVPDAKKAKLTALTDKWWQQWSKTVPDPKDVAPDAQLRENCY